MSEREGFLRAICAEPDDDTVRLAFADWLQEHGEPDRAEFIRIQCGRTHLPPSAENAAREAELRAKLFGHLDAFGFASVVCRRGFVDTITSGLRALRDHLAELHPDDAPAFELVVRELNEEGQPERDYIPDDRETAEVFANATLRRCVSLDLPCMGLTAASYVCKSSQLTGLQRFNFPNNEAGPAIEFVASPTFSKLRWANFYNSDSAFDCPSIVPFAECPHLTNLEYLNFGACDLPDEGLEALAKTPYLRKLRHLDITEGFFGSGLELFFHTDKLPALRELNLSHSFAGDEDATHCIFRIAGSPLFARLEKLWLCGNGIIDASAKALAASGRGPGLILLDLRDNPIGPAGQQALCERFGEDVCVFGKTDPD